MAIIAAHTAPNFAFGNYFRILKAEFSCAPYQPGNEAAIEPHWHILLGFYASADARDMNTQPMYVHVIDIKLSELPSDPRVDLYSLILQSPLFAGTSAVSDVPAEGESDSAQAS